MTRSAPSPSVGLFHGLARLLTGLVGRASAEGEGLLAARLHGLDGAYFRDAVEDSGLQAHQADGAGPDHDGVRHVMSVEPQARRVDTVRQRLRQRARAGLDAVG